MEFQEHVYSLPDGSVTQEGYGRSIAIPQEKEWHQFIRKMKSLPGISRGWIKPLLDGTQWYFSYEFEDHKINYEGSNEWPKEYLYIIKALQDLGQFIIRRY